MNLINTLLLSGSVGFLMIGIHQVMKNGLAQSYWIVMLTIALFGIYMVRRGKQVQQRQIDEMRAEMYARKEKLRQKHNTKSKKKKRKR